MWRKEKSSNGNAMEMLKKRLNIVERTIVKQECQED